MSGTGKQFMEHTKYMYLDESDQEKALPQPPLELEYDLSKKLIKLPKVKKDGFNAVSLIEAVEERRSLRQFSGDTMAMDELSLLLWCTQGVKEVKGSSATLRTVPSAGARHAFETYLLINNVEGLQPGLYRYLALEHSLIEINVETGIGDRITTACLGQGFVQLCNATFIWTAVPYRMNWRYGERGYRYMHLDAGHVCQNLYLAAQAVGCGVCAIAAFDDDEMNDVLGIDGENQFAIYIAAAGRK